ncbi:MAG: hypothetical protein CL441_02210 [Acidimicrobiaceae bacterium]|nr:hypothetical protein [Acidimicrobiaceae bacterium]
MTVDEKTRLEIRNWFREQLNDELADAIMEAMPPVEWAQVATRDEVSRLGQDLRAEMDLQGRELRAEMAELRAEIHLGFAGIRNDFADLKRWTAMSGIGIATSSWALAVAMVTLG